MTVVILNGKVIDEREATVSALDRGITHGICLYETVKLRDGIPVFFDEHAARMEKGLERLGIEPPVRRDELAKQIMALSAESGVRNGACRLLATAGPPWGPSSLLIQAEVRTFPDRPLVVISYRAGRAAAAFKSNSFVASLLAQRAAAGAAADDAVFVDDEGRILEATTANVFIVRGGVMTTPQTEGSILPGVIRSKVIDVAERDGIPVAERTMRLSELTSDNMLLLTSSVRGIKPAASLDGLPLRQDPALVERLRRLVGEAERAAAAAFTATYG